VITPRRWLQRALDDERLKARPARERHPIPDAPDLPLDRRVQHLECYLGRLWDQVWWLSLPWYRRLGFRLLGFTAPVLRFYLRPGEPWLP
jgi:hypothetical protein